MGSLTDLRFRCTVDTTVDDTSFVFGGKYGVYRVTETAGSSPRMVVTELSKYPIPNDRREEFRANDGGVDPGGHFWIAVMNDPLVKEPTNEGKRLRMPRFKGIHSTDTAKLFCSGTALPRLDRRRGSWKG